MISAKVVLDSIASGHRLTTFELTYPRFIHAELMTHRVFSRNAASSRAIPTTKKIERIRQDMAKPSEWGANKKGMQSDGKVSDDVELLAKLAWEDACSDALKHAMKLDGLGLHKQVANRILEPFDHITVVLSTTKLANHKKLRLHPDADPTYQELARKWHQAYDESTPHPLKLGEWHLPYVSYDKDGTRRVPGDDASPLDAENIELLKKVSVGRCARVSYLRQGNGDAQENIALCDRLAASGHWSPFEHQATPIDFVSAVGECVGCESTASYSVRGHRLCKTCGLGHVTSGNFVGWRQYRKEWPGESGGDE